MANEKRLIDVNKLTVCYINTGTVMFPKIEAFVRADDIADAPTVDAVELPCKVGNTVFFVDTECDENGEESVGISVGKIHSFSIQSEGLWAYCRYENGLTYWHKVSEHFGKKVFVTKEEAEAALSRMDGGQGNE